MRKKMSYMTNPEMTYLKIMDLRRWSAEDLMGFVTDPDAYAIWIRPDGSSLFKNEWCPDDESTGQIWMIIKKMRETLPDDSDGFNFNLNWQAHKGITVCLAQFHKIDPFIHGQGDDDNPCVATLIAAKDAWTRLLMESWSHGSPKN
jgi:hypothetical protein